MRSEPARLGGISYDFAGIPPTISDKKYEKNCYLDNFVFLSPSPS